MAETFVVHVVDHDGTEYSWTVPEDGRVFDRLVELLGEPDSTRL